MATENMEAEEDDDDVGYVRPVSITLISIWLLLSGLMVLWFTSRGYGASSALNTWFFIMGSIVSLVCGIGFWRMKKWALYIYAADGLITQVVLIALGRWNLFSLLYFGIVVFFGYKYRSEMT